MGILRGGDDVGLQPALSRRRAVKRQTGPLDVTSAAKA